MNKTKDKIVAINIAKWKAEKQANSKRKLHKRVSRNGLAFDAIKEALEDAIKKSRSD